MPWVVGAVAAGVVAVLALVAVLWHPWTAPAPAPSASQQEDHTAPQVPGAYPDIVDQPIVSAPVALCDGAVSGDYELRRFVPVPLVTADIDAGFAPAVVVVPDDDSYNNFAVRPVDEPDICGFDPATGETTWTLDLSTVGIQNPVMWGDPAASSDYMVVRIADVVVDADDEIPAGCGDHGEIPCGHYGEDGWASANKTETMWLFTVDLDSGDIVSQTSMPLYTEGTTLDSIRYVDGVVVVEETVAKAVGGYTADTVGRRDTDLEQVVWRQKAPNDGIGDSALTGGWLARWVTTNTGVVQVSDGENAPFGDDSDGFGSDSIYYMQVDDDTVLRVKGDHLSGGDFDLTLIDAGSGDEMWDTTVTVGDAGMGSATVPHRAAAWSADGVVLVNLVEGVVALDLDDGAQLWRRPGRDTIWMVGRPVDGMVALNGIGWVDRSLRVVDLVSGDQVATVEQASSVAGTHQVYVLRADDEKPSITAYTTADGWHEQWTVRLPSPELQTPLLVDGRWLMADLYDSGAVVTVSE